MQVFRVDEIHGVRRRTADRVAATYSGLERIAGKALKAAVEDDIRAHITKRLKANLREVRRATIGLNPLDGLQALKVKLPVVAVSNNQIGNVAPANELLVHRVHVVLNIGRGRRRAAVGNSGVSDVLPEGPR